MLCNKCNQQLPNDSEFCQYCGAKLEVAPANAQNAKVSNDSVVNVEVVEATEELSETKVENAPVEIVEPEASVLTIADETSSRSANQKNEEVHSDEKTSVTQKEPKREAPISVPDKTTNKTRYCKMCGGLIDKKSKKCTSCGKQFFKFPKLSKAIIIPALICLALVILNIFSYVLLANSNSTITKQNQEIIELKKDVDKYKEQAKNYLNNYFEKAFFMDRYIVIIGDSNNRYHKLGCSDLDTSNFYAYNVDNAKAQGYLACSKCN